MSGTDLKFKFELTETFLDINTFKNAKFKVTRKVIDDSRFNFNVIFQESYSMQAVRNKT